MMRITWIAALCALGSAVGAYAQTPPAPPASAATAAPQASPYAATVPVAGTSVDQRNSAIGAALTQVLQQVAPGFAATPAQLAQAAGYVRAYHYQRAPSGAGLQLQVQFDPGAVGRLVQQGGGAAAPALAGAPGASSGAGAGTSAAAGSATASAAGAQAAASGTASVWVGGIGNSQAFAALLGLLRGDPQLHRVVPVAASGDGVMLQLAYSAPLNDVLAALGGPTGHLAPAASQHAGADASLQWTP